MGARKKENHPKQESWTPGSDGNNSGANKSSLREASGKPGRTKKRRVLFILKVFFILAAVSAILSAGAGFMIWKRIIDRAPDISAFSFRPQGFATILYDSAGNETEKLVMEGANREEAAFEEFPRDLTNAFIAIEDERFWENNGIDLRAILRAAKGVLTGNSSAGGGSTITQQLIKNTVFGGGMEESFEERIERKLQEQYLAVKLNRQMDKKTILTNYLNTINLGSNTLGVKVAARRYFDKDVSELTLSECAVLAGITKNPSRLNPLTHPKDNQKRRTIILNKMEEQGMISEAEKMEALADNVYERISDADAAARASASPFSYFTDEVIQQVTDTLVSQLGYSPIMARNLLYGGGLSIYTTQDPHLQAIVDEEIANPENYTAAYLAADYRLSIRHPDGSMTHCSERDIKAHHKELKDSFDGLYGSAEEMLADIEGFKTAVLGEGDEIAKESLVPVLQPQVSFVLIDSATGRVKAISGGRGEKAASRTLNRATGSLRQPGSTFKVITAFAPALDSKNATLASVYYDEPYKVGKKSFRNWYGRYMGYSSIREGIVYSMNILAVRCLMETVSVDTGIQYARELGISTLTENDYNASTALGGITNGVSNLELTAAFAAIANHGEFIKPVFFDKIVDHDGNVLYQSTPERRQALKPETAFLLTDALREAVSGGAKFSASPISPPGRRTRLSNMTSAGKTGTTTNNKDLWFVGFTPYYTAGIWSGNDGSEAVRGGTSYHKDIWKKIMERVHEGLPDPGFPPPEGVNQILVCRKSGKLAIPGVCTNDPRGNAVYSEYFAAGTAPAAFCDRHIKSEICTESGQTATDFCPVKATGVFMVLPVAGGTTEDSQYGLPVLCMLHRGDGSIIAPPEEPSEEIGPEPEDEETESRPQAESKPWWEDWPNSGTKPWWEDWPQWETKPGTGNKPETGTKPQTESRPQTESKPQVESRPQMESKPQAESRPQWETRPQTETRPQWETRPQAGTRPQWESKPQTETRPDKETGSQLETRPPRGLQPKGGISQY